MVVGVIIDNFHRCRDQIEAIDGAKKKNQTIASHIVDGERLLLPIVNRVLFPETWKPEASQMHSSGILKFGVLVHCPLVPKNKPISIKKCYFQLIDFFNS